ncbi:NADH:ubiquinone oxidoreductase intermediate-associated protein 30 [Syncephalis pseudoplumigaleata]|uniref:NADH:ubiquinone oxidoreductase intermediate-associated protein 30 n=1 Tax=Syncephalis pseudoplumigaleata TaxID=1712513 RepID=A0A4P9YSU2_9FUNG|nr:NADH:ubiquinone oxidoreductase intermediate-associated protein 30 [Syncephalis pseudoplumigaleata]|eukprot:RKP22947.1 NADH:ubiquinone oxidoreductase intermediate-associated protein 30 [Syncephalis pseudoplumigaleata]
MDVLERVPEQLLFQFNKDTDLKQWIVGCDKDIGGQSTAAFELTAEGKARFHGNISLSLPLKRKEFVRSGYAAIRSREAHHTLLGSNYWDTGIFRFLCLRVRGDRRRYMVNLQTDGVIKADLFQHRLFLRRPGQWENVLIGFRDFTLTHNGLVLPEQMQMMRESVRTIGFSVMDGQEGPFSLEIDSIKMINTDGTDGEVDVQPDGAAKITLTM